MHIWNNHTNIHKLTKFHQYQLGNEKLFLRAVSPLSCFSLTFFFNLVLGGMCPWIMQRGGHKVRQYHCQPCSQLRLNNEFLSDCSKWACIERLEAVAFLRSSTWKNSGVSVLLQSCPATKLKCSLHHYACKTEHWHKALPWWAVEVVCCLTWQKVDKTLVKIELSMLW